MKLQRVDDGGVGAAAPQTSDVPGHAAFTLSSERQQLIGVTTARVERRALTRTIRAPGTVAYDPELYQALVDYREAVSATGKDAPPAASALARGAMLRLRQRGLTSEQITAMVRAGGDQTTLLLPGKTAWVYARVFEYEIGLVEPGQSVQVSTPLRPGQSYLGQVVAVDRLLDDALRVNECGFRCVAGSSQHLAESSGGGLDFADVLTRFMRLEQRASECQPGRNQLVLVGGNPFAH